MQSGKTSDKGRRDAPNRRDAPAGRLYSQYDLPGDPNCPYCGGVGYLRLDVPPGHPDFGRLQVCSCRSAQVSNQVRQRLFALSNLDELGHLTFENFLSRGGWACGRARLNR